MKAICKSIVMLPGVVAFVAGCALPGLNHAKFAHGESQLTVARSYEQQGKTEEAARIYLSLIQSTPNQAEPYHRLGVLAAAAGEYDRAEQYFLQAQSLDPHDPDLLNDLGYVQLLQGRLAEAERFLRLALRNDPQHARAKNNLGMVLGRRGRLQESLAMFRQVLPEAEARQNLAHVAGQSSDAVHPEEFEAPVARLAAGEFAPNQATRPVAAQDPAYVPAAPVAPSTPRLVPAVANRSAAAPPATTNHAVSSMVRASASSGTSATVDRIFPPVAPRGTQRTSRSVTTTRSPRSSNALTATGAGEKNRAPAPRTATNLPRLFEQPTWSRGSWSSERAPSAAQRIAQSSHDRLVRGRSDETAAVAAARTSAQGTGRSWRTGETTEPPRLFGPPMSAR